MGKGPQTVSRADAPAWLNALAAEARGPGRDIATALLEVNTAAHRTRILEVVTGGITIAEDAKARLIACAIHVRTCIASLGKNPGEAIAALRAAVQGEGAAALGSDGPDGGERVDLARAAAATSAAASGPARAPRVAVAPTKGRRAPEGGG